MTVLVGEAFSRLDLTAQRVMQALATYRYPVPPAAVDYLLQPHVAGIDSGRVLSRLVNMQFVHRDAGRYYLHQVDRDYALSRIADGEAGDRDAPVAPMTRFALRHRAAEWFKLSRKPREAWKALGDLAAQLSEFELRCEGDDYDTAAAVLLEFDYEYLYLWGHYRLMTELHERLGGKIADPQLAETSVGNLGMAYHRMGQLQRGIECFEQALEMARRRNDPSNEGAWLTNLANCVADLGQHALAIGYLEQSLASAREFSERQAESTILCILANRYGNIGQNHRAVEYYEQALQIDREVKNAKGEAADLLNLGVVYENLGRLDDASRCLTDALATARKIGYRLIEAAALANIGDLRLAQDDLSDAARQFEQAIEIADDVGNPQISQLGREAIAEIHLLRNNLGAARILVEAAKQYDVPVRNASVSAMLGMVSLLEGHRSAARDAFTAALNHAGRLLELNPEQYEALDVKGLSLCGLGLCGEPAGIPAAKAAYQAARAVTSDAGIVRAALQRFDSLARADKDGLLAGVRPVAAGAKTD